MLVAPHIAHRIREIGRQLAERDTKVRPVGFKAQDRLKEVLIEQLLEHDYDVELRVWSGQLTLLLMQMPWRDEAHPRGGGMWKAVAAERIQDALGSAAGSLGIEHAGEDDTQGPGLIVAP